MMTHRPNNPRSSGARRLAVVGAFVTGVAGIAMAVFSVIGGESTGAGALLAASALAFGLLAANVDRAFAAPSSGEAAQAADDGSPPAEAGEQSPTDLKPGQATIEPITEREFEILGLMADGNSNKQISARLVISERTVINHLSHVKNKLGASDRTHAVVIAIRNGWLDIPSNSS